VLRAPSAALPAGDQIVIAVVDSGVDPPFPASFVGCNVFDGSSDTGDNQGHGTASRG
jgi:subtilisin family serine protease